MHASPICIISHSSSNHFTRASVLRHYTSTCSQALGWRFTTHTDTHTHTSTLQPRLAIIDDDASRAMAAAEQNICCGRWDGDCDCGGGDDDAPTRSLRWTFILQTLHSWVARHDSRQKKWSSDGIRNDAEDDVYRVQIRS